MIVPEVLLEEFKTPARGQGTRQTCMAFAISDLNRQFAPADLSPEYLCQRVALANPAWAPRSGITFPDAQQAAQNGQPEEIYFPYRSADPRPPIPALPNDLPHFGGAPQYVSGDPTDVAFLIRAGRAVGLGLRITPEFFTPEAGVIRHSDEVLSQRLHAVVAVGLGHMAGQNTPWFFIRNSWGPTWGLQGHAWISGEYVAMHAACAFGVEHGQDYRQ
ncbi:C1 family peptidase [Pseudomonas aeruginosa]|uniref:C1 family peptidase n=1 Tax=Pseudomonas aeruginosa TaxID=287 RepID=UPI0009A500D5|nr:C1 family peptidase [Pseudomonas aeruginosa]MBG3966876.1 C1 family peptidase [Pseudomonas aeruginosa]MBG6935880.1 C1 family peptidase [Pseudomonas aeruginosa]MBG6947421.1 C1 family peptidase [Pseudomonas aeruginosa]MBG7069699.1 C1 family peptidase [Pseudomonas aeruginosa]MBG7349870.1 C1 family peptidase [Pseudomonas aeruginosa]